MKKRQNVIAFIKISHEEEKDFVLISDGRETSQVTFLISGFMVMLWNNFKKKSDTVIK